MAVREVIVPVDRVPLAAQEVHGALVRFLPALGDGDVRQDDGRARLVPDAPGDLAVAVDVGGGGGPLVLHDDEHAEAQLGHDLGGLWAHRRGVEAPLGMRDRPGPDRGRRDLVELAVPGEDVVGQGLDDDLRRLHEAGPRLLHRDAESRVLDARRAAAEPEEAPPPREHVEESDLLGDPDGIVPGQHDHRGPEGDPLRPAGVVAQELGWRRRHGVAGEVVLEGEERIEAERLGEVAEGHVLGEDVSVGAIFLGQHVERDTNFHDAPPRG